MVALNGDNDPIDDPINDPVNNADEPVGDDNPIGNATRDEEAEDGDFVIPVKFPSSKLKE